MCRESLCASTVFFFRRAIFFLRSQYFSSLFTRSFFSDDKNLAPPPPLLYKPAWSIYLANNDSSGARFYAKLNSAELYIEGTSSRKGPSSQHCFVQGCGNGTIHTLSARYHIKKAALTKVETEILEKLRKWPGSGLRAPHKLLLNELPRLWPHKEESQADIVSGFFKVGR